MLRSRAATRSAGDSSLPRTSKRTCQTPVGSTYFGLVPLCALFQPTGTSAVAGALSSPNASDANCSESALRPSPALGVSTG